jgi:hypothetical protein
MVDRVHCVHSGSGQYSQALSQSGVVIPPEGMNFRVWSSPGTQLTLFNSRSTVWRRHRGSQFAVVPFSYTMHIWEVMCGGDILGPSCPIQSFHGHVTVVCRYLTNILSGTYYYKEKCRKVHITACRSQGNAKGDQVRTYSGDMESTRPDCQIRLQSVESRQTGASHGSKYARLDTWMKICRKRQNGHP